jgi:hypothetical protein
MKPYGWAGLLLLIVSEACLILKIEPVYSWFYSFAWWSYILLADNLLLRVTGSSLLTTRRRELFAMLPFSVFIWLLFEVWNLELRNWGYAGVPSDIRVRWPGYLLAFATVLPGIFITSDLAGFALFGRDARRPSGTALAAPTRASEPSRVFIACGILLCVASLAWPRLFFPAVWIGPIFLLDPLLEKLSRSSLSLAIVSGERRRVWSLLAGGLLCGLMWEFWNFWAGTKWVYMVPFFGSWKVFEMPVLGFLGFPPFALECWILYHLLRVLHDRSRALPARVALWGVIALFSLLAFYGMDKNTVVRFAENLTEGSAPWYLG